MALYIVGDIQGCYSELKALLKQVSFNAENDQLWAAGDIIARGDESLETIRFVKSLGKSFKMVLGNHDLHLLAIYHGIKKDKKSDKLEKLLSAPDLDEIVKWLSKQPLLLKIPKEKSYISHAGLNPQWTVKEAKENAKFAENLINSKEQKKWLTTMYGEKPNNWAEVKTIEERFRFTINSFTRMRFCYLNGQLEFSNKQNANNAPSNIIPWFNLVPQLDNKKWIFGHWASLLGECNNKNTYALDTGCVWGNNLTMIRWDDKKLFKEQSHK